MKGLRFSLSHVQVHDWQFFVGPIQSINFHQITPCALLQLVFWPLIAEQTSFYIGRCPGSGTTLKNKCVVSSSFQDDSRQELPFRMLSQSIVKSLILELDITVVKNWLNRRHAPIHVQLATFLALNYLGDGIQNYGRRIQNVLLSVLTGGPGLNPRTLGSKPPA